MQETTLGPNFMVVIHPTNIMEFSALRGQPTVEQLRQAVLGDLELVPHFTTMDGRPCLAFCNEHGKLNGMRLNPLAQTYWEKAVGRRIDNDSLVGPICVIVGTPEFLREM